MLSKGVVESSLFFKDEPLTPNIDKVMPVWTFRRKAQNTKIGKFGFLISGFYFFSAYERRNSLKKNLLDSFEAASHFKINLIKIPSVGPL